MVAAGLMGPIDIQTAFSAPAEVAARTRLPNPERYPDPVEAVAAFQNGEITSIDIDLARLLAWHAGCTSTNLRATVSIA
jgi:hypothetical protein